MPQVAQQDELRITVTTLDEPEVLSEEIKETAKRLSKQGILMGAILVHSDYADTSRIVATEFDAVTGELTGFSYIYGGNVCHCLFDE